jgi:hypothetical protein
MKEEVLLRIEEIKKKLEQGKQISLDDKILFFSLNLVKTN